MFLISTLTLNFFLQKDLEREAVADATWAARILLDRNLAIHNYFTHELRPGLLAKFRQLDFPAAYFDPSWMSSSYAIRKMGTYPQSHSNPKFIYKEVAVNARNPQNEANPFERQFLEQLNRDPTLEEKSFTQIIDGIPYFVLMHRGEMMEESCLRCHGDPADAPADLTANYGNVRGFHRPPGKIVSAVSINFPIAADLARMQGLSHHHLGWMLSILLGVCLLQWLICRRFIVDPLCRFREMVSLVAKDDQYLGEQIEVSNWAEMAEVAKACNALSTNLAESRNNLEQQIEKRTADLEKTNQRLNDLIAAAPVSIIALNPAGIVTEWNPAAETVFGWKRAETLGRLNPIIPKGQEDEFNELHEQALCGQFPGRKILRRQKKDGGLIDIYLSTSPLIDSTGKSEGVIGILEDITERQRTEQKLLEYQQQLRSLSAELSLIEERERRLIARDLHDNLGQTLALAKIKLGALQAFHSSVSISSSFQEINSLLAESINYTRTLTWKVSPQILYTLPFLAAVEWLAEQLLSSNNISFEVVDDNRPKPLTDDSRVLLFKTVRELLMNIVKHAQATKVTILLRREADHLLIEVNDNGKGFNPEQQDLKPLAQHSYGLFSIQERLTYLEGELVILCPPSQGTQISIMAPLLGKTR
jgi:PAS domain S-box-containing protein